MTPTPAAELESLPDAQLEELFALEIAGWKRVELSQSDKELKVAARFTKPGEMDCVRWVRGNLGGDKWPNFCASADAVFPHLEEFEYVDISKEHDDPVKKWTVAIAKTREGTPLFFASSPTIPRSAVIARLKASRAGRGTT